MYHQLRALQNCMLQKLYDLFTLELVFPTVYFREELCYNRHNGNGKIDIMLKDNSIIKKQEPRPLRTRLLLNGNRNLKFVYC